MSKRRICSLALEVTINLERQMNNILPAVAAVGASETKEVSRGGTPDPSSLKTVRATLSKFSTANK